jgi:hypothetical protein
MGWVRIRTSGRVCVPSMAAVQDEGVPDQLLDLLEKLDNAEAGAD